MNALCPCDFLFASKAVILFRRGLQVLCWLVVVCPLNLSQPKSVDTHGLISLAGKLACLCDGLWVNKNIRHMCKIG